MLEETIYDLMGTQLAVRRLRSDPIPDEVLSRIMEAASCAPSGGNAQPWRMLMVRDAQKKAHLGELYDSVWQKVRETYVTAGDALEGEELARHGRTLAAGDYLCQHFGETPVVAVVCFNEALVAGKLTKELSGVTDANLGRTSVVGGASIYPAVQNFMLACRAEGVGCVLTTLLCVVESEVKALLEIPEGWYTAATIPMGYPVGKGYGRPVRRKGIHQTFFGDTWKQPLSAINVEV